MNAKRTRDPEATQETLLNAAEEVFLEKGFGNTSITDISKRAGITKSLVHHYFGSKEGLWNAVKERRFNYYADVQMEMLENQAPSKDLLRDSMILYFNFLKENPQLIRILAWIFLERDQDECFKKDQELIETGIALLKKAQEEGVFRSDIDPKFILFIFLGLCRQWFQDRDHFISDYHFNGDDIPENADEAYLDAILKIFFEGVSS